MLENARDFTRKLCYFAGSKFNSRTFACKNFHTLLCKFFEKRTNIFLNWNLPRNQAVGDTKFCGFTVYFKTSVVIWEPVTANHGSNDQSLKIKAQTSRSSLPANLAVFKTELSCFDQVLSEKPGELLGVLLPLDRLKREARVLPHEEDWKRFQKHIDWPAKKQWPVGYSGAHVRTVALMHFHHRNSAWKLCSVRNKFKSSTQNDNLLD